MALNYTAPRIFFAFGSALKSRRHLTANCFPLCAAIWRGVFFSESVFLFISAPALNRCDIVSADPE